MKAVQVSAAGGDLEVVDRDVPIPDPDQVRIEVEACGVCHGDEMAKTGALPGTSYPQIPGHEVAGRIDVVGDDVTEWQEGDRVTVGWHAGHCFICDACRHGDFFNCETETDVTGITRNGGYAEYMVASHEALARIPKGLDAVSAGPLVCAGLTAYNALRHADGKPGDLVAVQGVGGVGHMGFSSPMQPALRPSHFHGEPIKKISRSISVPTTSSIRIRRIRQTSCRSWVVHR